jgi:serine/threonine-protein kinase
MPKLTGYSLSEAKSLIAQSGLIYGEVSYEPSSTYDKDIVMSQSPSAYAAVDKNTRVNLVVSLGPETAKTVTFHLSSLYVGCQRLDGFG